MNIISNGESFKPAFAEADNDRSPRNLDKPVIRLFRLRHKVRTVLYNKKRTTVYVPSSELGLSQPVVGKMTTFYL